MRTALSPNPSARTLSMRSGQITMTACEFLRMNRSIRAKSRLRKARPREFEILELLGQARMHVVEVGDAGELAQEDPGEGGFLVGEDEVVAGAEERGPAPSG